MKRTRVLSRGIQTLIFCSASVSTGGLVLALIDHDGADSKAAQTPQTDQPATNLINPQTSRQQSKAPLKVAAPEPQPATSFSSSKASSAQAPVSNTTSVNTQEADLLAYAPDLADATQSATSSTTPGSGSNLVQNAASGTPKQPILLARVQLVTATPGHKASSGSATAAQQPSTTKTPTLTSSPTTSPPNPVSSANPDVSMQGSPSVTPTVTATRQPVMTSVATPELMSPAQSSIGTSTPTTAATVRSPEVSDSQNNLVNTPGLDDLRQIQLVQPEEMPTVVVRATPFHSLNSNGSEMPGSTVPDNDAPVSANRSVGIPEMALFEQRLPNREFLHSR